MISGFEATTEEDRDAIRRLLTHYHTLKQEVHLPLMDTLLFDKYIVTPTRQFCEDPNARDEESDNDEDGGAANAAEGRHAAADGGDLQNSPQDNGTTTVPMYPNEAAAKSEREKCVAKLAQLVTVVMDHKQRTLEVLECVMKREAAWKKLIAVLDSSSSKKNTKSKADNEKSKKDANNKKKNQNDGDSNNGGYSDDDDEKKHSSSNNNNSPSHDDPPKNQKEGDDPTTNNEGDQEDPTLSPYETAALVQHCLYHIQRTSLLVVEAIQRWREGLSIPCPFMVGGDNYLLKIMSDAALLAADPTVAVALPMGDLFMAHPLYANVPSLTKFAEDPTKELRSSMSKKPTASGSDSHVALRLQAAEGAVHRELSGQLTMLHQLLGLAQKNRFVPMLQGKGLYPPTSSGGAAAPKVSSSSSSSGAGGAAAAAAGGGGGHHGGGLRSFPLKSLELQQKLESTLLHALDHLHNPPFRGAYEENKKKKEESQQKQQQQHKA